MNLNFFTTLTFILYFCSATISEESSTVPSITSQSKNSSDGSQLYCLGGRFDNHEPVYFISKMNSAGNQWEEITKMTSTHYFFGATVIGKKIYVCLKPRDYDQSLNILEVFDCETNTWDNLASMSQRRAGFGMTTLNGRIYVAGGLDFDDSKILSTVMRYSPERNKWTMFSEMNEPRFFHELVTLNGEIYAIGGRDTKTVERYSFLMKDWIYVASTNHEHEQFGVTTHRNKIYVLSNRGFEVYHPESNIWQDLPPLNVKLTRIQLVFMNDRLLSIGGREAPNLVFEFDIGNNSWIRLQDMNTLPNYHRIVRVNF